MKPKILSLALVLSGVLIKCSHIAQSADDTSKGQDQPHRRETNFTLGSYKGIIIFEDHTNEFWVNLGIDEFPGELPTNITSNIQVWVLGNVGAALPFKWRAPPRSSQLPYAGSGRDRIVLGSMTFAFDATKDVRPEAAVLRIKGQYQVFSITNTPAIR
jgi:hypothetical protein